MDNGSGNKKIHLQRERKLYEEIDDRELFRDSTFVWCIEWTDDERMNLKIIINSNSIDNQHTLVILSGSGAINIPGGGSLNTLHISLMNKIYSIIIFNIKITLPFYSC